MKSTLNIILVLTFILGCAHNTEKNEQEFSDQSDIIEDSKNEISEFEQQKNVNQKELNIDIENKKTFEKEMIKWSE